MNSQNAVRGIHQLLGQWNAGQKLFAHLVEIAVIGGHFSAAENRPQRLRAQRGIDHAHVGWSKLAVAAYRQQVRRFVTSAKRIRAIANVLCAAIPEIAEVENCVQPRSACCVRLLCEH